MAEDLRLPAELPDDGFFHGFFVDDGNDKVRDLLDEAELRRWIQHQHRLPNQARNPNPFLAHLQLQAARIWHLKHQQMLLQHQFWLERQRNAKGVAAGHCSSFSPSRRTPFLVRTRLLRFFGRDHFGSSDATRSGFVFLGRHHTRLRLLGSAFLALDARCSSISCFGWRIAPRLLLDSPQDFGEELRRVYLENGGQELDPKLVDVAPDSVDDLISEMNSPSFYQHLDLRSFLLKTKAMLLKMDQKVQFASLQVIVFQHLASIGLPKSIHCLTLRLAEEYLINVVA